MQLIESFIFQSLFQFRVFFLNLWNFKFLFIQIETFFTYSIVLWLVKIIFQKNAFFKDMKL